MNDMRPSVPPPVARPEEALPPVEPPSAGFLVQLFLIPFIIVSVVVGVWLGLHWIAHMGSTPREMVAQLESLDVQTKHDHAWQIANDLAVMLSGRDSAIYRRDAALAKQLAAILDRECQRKEASDERIELRIFVCTALGQFEVPDGLPALVRATAPSQPAAVQQAAIEAIALLGDAARLGPTTLREAPEVITVLTRASESFPAESEDQARGGAIRSRAAYALGVIGGPHAVEALVHRLGDPFTDARYNAAAGLARQGDLRAIPQLLEMLQLQPGPPAPANTPKQDQAGLAWKQQIVWETGLNAVESLLSQQTLPAAERDAMRAAVDSLAQHSTGLIRAKANAVAEQIKKLSARDAT